MKYHDFRRQYLMGGLRREDLNESPYVQFKIWLEHAISSEIRDPTAMCLATIDKKGKLWQRIVLMKDFSNRGFTFFSNYKSTKGLAISHNPQVSLVFPWNELDRQVIVGGLAERISREESAAYFVSRPRQSQLVALASRQSSSIADRETMVTMVRELDKRYADQEIPLPEDWGGYRVKPFRIEFWQGGENRLHDRFIYELDVDHLWQIKRLQP